jgi:anti-anti-sigma regulatory factor
MIEETTAPGGEILISLDGALDAFAAWQIRGRLVDLPLGASVVLDFTAVNEFFDLGVAVMAHVLAEAQRAHVVTRGLREQQHRMFRYFGVELDASPGGSPNALTP